MSFAHCSPTSSSELLCVARKSRSVALRSCLPEMGGILQGIIREHWAFA